MQAARRSQSNCHRTPSAVQSAVPALMLSHRRRRQRSGKGRTMQQVAGHPQIGDWDDRIFPGLRLPSVPADARDALVQALGTLGVEAEHFIAVVAAFTAGGPTAPATRTDGDHFLWQLEASSRRLAGAAEVFELATQAYLAALESAYGELRGPADRDGRSPAEVADTWWPAQQTGPGLGEPLELGLRRCGYAYRHVVTAHLATNVEAVAEQLTLVLHALATLPPAGVLPISALYNGLYELAATFQGHIVPHHLSDVSAQTPGLLTGIGLLRRLDATDDRSLEADIAWARAQLRQVEQVSAQLPPVPTLPDHPTRRGLAGLFQRARQQPATGAAASASAQAWAARAVREWRETVAALESLHARGAASIRAH